MIYVNPLILIRNVNFHGYFLSSFCFCQCCNYLTIIYNFCFHFSMFIYTQEVTNTYMYHLPLNSFMFVTSDDFKKKPIIILIVHLFNPTTITFLHCPSFTIFNCWFRPINLCLYNFFMLFILKSVQNLISVLYNHF